ncbi:MAG: HAD family hydrolase [SAR202 cluster bacterium]|nr:HAD family hydrolase [SAR202 cluster bacterium]
MVDVTVRAIVFDFDGTILETESPAYESMREIFDRLGVPLTMDIWGRVIGGTAGKFDIFDLLESRLGRMLDRDALRSEQRAKHHDIVMRLQVLPGVASHLREAKSRGLKLAVASSSSRGWVEGHLERLALLPHFDALRTRDDVARTKPEPDVYLAALAALGVEPHEAIAIEDSPNGVTAARAAGIFCVAVPNLLTRQLSLEHADLVVETLEAIRLEQLLTMAVARHAAARATLGPALPPTG